MSLRVLEKETLRVVFKTLSNAYDEVFLQKWFISFNSLLFSQKSSAISVQHNPKCVSDIFLTIFSSALIDCLKQTYKIFRTAIFQDVSKDLILSYDLISLFPSIEIFFTTLYMEPCYYNWFGRESKDFITVALWKFLQKLGKCTCFMVG